MQVLVINSGSSSVKFRLVEVGEEPGCGLTTRPALLQGAVKGIGGVASFEVTGQAAGRSTTTLEIRDHAHALLVQLDRLAGSLDKVQAVGLRVVHGGDQYVKSTMITKQVEAGIDALSELAPLHNPSCLAGIRGAREVLGSTRPMVAVFDTAFHQTMPEVARQYALPVELAAAGPGRPPIRATTRARSRSPWRRWHSRSLMTRGTALGTGDTILWPKDAASS